MNLKNILGDVHRKIPISSPMNQRILYLTFDDGPTELTPEILDLLAAEEAVATFFLIGEKALAHRQLVTQMIQQGHAIGNHSKDHRYHHYFKSQDGVKTWVSESESILRGITGTPTVGFRAPAGIQTPPLHRALRDLNMPLIHWDKRFFDRVIAWTPEKAIDAINDLESGSIILLHDFQKNRYAQGFMKTLKVFIRNAKHHGYEFRPIPKGLDYSNEAPNN
jgi:peptidoglycan/xylan/chitin deacetylase (PgdA/CDA1 family)